ncbi:hydroxymethylglutaryl-CoA reductase [Nocardia arizonensis]|uniref:hydroxymethylglutaryl-CoA reductase n=1 Tax=Nocardia arizonensis TaxID=1141647 RepID=UPI0006D01335|nr:hydroxymethylglutaryl-CoA reductase [Nocardia arizonensis]
MTDLITPLPTSWVGPIRISGSDYCAETKVPLATYESPLWPSVGRGARVTRLVDEGVAVTVVRESMTRSVALATDTAAEGHRISEWIHAELDKLRIVASSTSRYLRLEEAYTEVAGNLVFVRFSFTTGSAAGHNMATLAAERLLRFLLDEFPYADYGSISGNMCTDKKNSSINGILGRGRSCVADILIPRDIVRSQLRTTAAEFVSLNVRKNLVGSILAGGVRTANAHYANMIAAFYLATGQDVANIVEGSQGVTYCEDRNGDLYFSCQLPNLIIGSVGTGKNLPTVAENMRGMGIDATGDEAASRKLAAICAATVLCGELSLLAAQTNIGELMESHVKIERGRQHG